MHLLIQISDKIIHPPHKVLLTLERALEWRFFAFILSGIVVYLYTGEFWEATLLSLVLQLILFVGHSVWYYFRGHIPEEEHQS